MRQEMKFARLCIGITLIALTGLVPIASTAGADQPIRLALIDPLSGPFAKSGDVWLKTFRFLAEKMNADGGILGRDLEIVPFDNKGSAQTSLQLLDEVIDEGIRYVGQGNGSHVAGALIFGVDKHNRRNPDNRILYLNHAAIDPALTNEKCSFWHFRFDSNSRMKLKAIVDVMAKNDEIKKVFLINQDYSHGQFISKAAKEMLARQRPDIEIVGDILHPVGKVKDFSPYVSQIKQSKADAVITGNWDNDVILLIKAGAQAGLKIDWYTYYAGGLGVPTTLGDQVANHLKVVAEWQENLPVRYDAPELAKLAQEFEKRYAPLEFYFLHAKTELDMLKKAMEQAGTTEPLAVARAMEGMKVDTAFGEAVMRAGDHQLLQTLFVSTLGDDFLEYRAEGTDYGWKMDARIPIEDLRASSSCKMQRP